MKVYEKEIVEMKAQNKHLYNNQAVYIGKKRDKIDMGLAKALNDYPDREKMSILFIRESEGVYQFGHRRVYLKIEKGNRVLVKVGGGYLTVKEFIDKYTAQEVEKVRR